MSFAGATPDFAHRLCRVAACFQSQIIQLARQDRRHSASFSAERETPGNEGTKALVFQLRSILSQL